MKDERQSRRELMEEVAALRRRVAEMEGIAPGVRHTEAEYGAVLANMPIGYALHETIVDGENRPVDYVFLEANEAFEELTGLKREAILGQRVTEAIPGIEHSAADWIGVYGTVALTGQKAQFEAYSELLGRWYSVSAYCPRPGYFATMFVDTTQHKQTEAELRSYRDHLEELVQQRTLELNRTKEQLAVDAGMRETAEQALEASNERYRRIVDTAQEGIWVIDAEMKTVFVNQRLADMLGYSRQEILDGSYFDFVDDATRDDVRRMYARRKTGISEQHDRKFRRKDGSELWTIVSANPILDAHGEVVSSLAMVTDITERRVAEERLRISEEKFRTAVETMMDSFAIFSSVRDDSGRIVDFRVDYLNPAAGARSPAPREQLIGRLLSQVLPRRHPDLVAASVRVAETGQSLQQESLEWSPDESQVTSALDVRIARCVDGLAVAWRDITGRKQAEEALRQSEQAMSALLNAATETIFLMDTEGTILIANEVMARRFGKEHRDMIGACLYDLLPPEVARNRKMQVEEVVRSRAAVRFEDVRFGRLIDSSHYPIVDSRGSVARIAVFGRDITESRQAERALRQSERLYRTLSESSPDGIYVMGTDARVVFANTIALRHFGKTSSDVIGKPLDRLLPAEAIRALRDLVEPRILAGETVRFEDRIERDGEDVWFDVALAPILGETGELTGMMSIVRDITERKRSEEKLRTTAQELARSNSELEQFAYVASHDLQEPLRSIAGYLQLLQRRYGAQLDDQAQKYIARSVAATGRMQTLINDLLAYSRVTSRGRPFQLTDCGVVLELALKNLQSTIEESQAIVTHGPLPHLMTDGSQLGPVFQNLVANAIKFRSEARPEIHISAQLQGGLWEFVVQDNGIGLEPQYAERIFVIFQRLHTTAEYPGTGIGLAICRRVIERHGGRIWVESEPGRGSAFHFTIPEVDSAPPGA